MAVSILPKLHRPAQAWLESPEKVKAGPIRHSAPFIQRPTEFDPCASEPRTHARSHPEVPSTEPELIGDDEENE